MKQVTQKKELPPTLLGEAAQPRDSELPKLWARLGYIGSRRAPTNSWSSSPEEILVQVIHKHFLETPIPAFLLPQAVDSLAS